jgi:predicted acyl esterase
MRRGCIVAAAAGCLLAVAAYSPAQVTPGTPDIPAHFAFPASMFDYTVREEMIPMRDGARLHTVIVVPNGARHAPMVLTRTPYSARRLAGNGARLMRDALPLGDDVFVESGYIRIYQDVRGKYGSEGDYFMAPPLRGTINDAQVGTRSTGW